MRRSGYTVLGSSEEDVEGDAADGKYEDIEEAKPFANIRSIDGNPYRKTLCLVFTLFFGGLLTLLVSTLILLGHLDNDVYADRLIPLIILGFLMFIPGSYYMRIVYYTFKERPGYSYDLIPSCN
ncbi:CLUMA_CG017341, isoform A [Clunio marinus]|uniref:Transmembrane protein 230 n=1 Tax=Clunio marinus TaxID=568069 RepID=A0A1J1IVN5_9DIPT|nr:CLUMA_CG017341, isoform A [Clunio marinus]